MRRAWQRTNQRTRTSAGTVPLLVFALSMLALGCDGHRGGQGTVPADGTVIVPPTTTGGGDGGSGSDGGWYGDPGFGADPDCGCDGSTEDGTDASDGSDTGGDSGSGGMDGSDSGGDGAGGELTGPSMGPTRLGGHALQAPRALASGPAPRLACIHGVVSDELGRRLAGASVTAQLDGPVDATEALATTGRAGHFCLGARTATGATVTVTTSTGGTASHLIDAASSSTRDGRGCLQVWMVIPADH